LVLDLGYLARGTEGNCEAEGEEEVESFAFAMMEF